MRKKRDPSRIKKKVNETNSNKVELGYLNSILDYNPKTGNLTWKHRPENHFKDVQSFKMWNKRFPNKTAGSLHHTGYIHIGIDNKGHRAHRLCYAMYHGYMPENEIDHRDRIRHHNWINNLRESSHQCNMKNKTMYSNNKSGVTGVYFYKSTNKWMAHIKANQKRMHLGYFKLFDDAVIARWNAEVFYNYPDCCTFSSSYNYLKNKGLI